MSSTGHRPPIRLGFVMPVEECASLSRGTRVAPSSAWELTASSSTAHNSLTTPPCGQSWSTSHPGCLNWPN